MKRNVDTHIANRVDVNVVLGVLSVRNKWLDKELSENTVDGLDSLRLASSSLDPFSAL